MTLAMNSATCSREVVVLGWRVFGFGWVSVVGFFSFRARARRWVFFFRSFAVGRRLEAAGGGGPPIALSVLFSLTCGVYVHHALPISMDLDVETRSSSGGL